MAEIPEKFKQPYDPEQEEARMRALWDESGVFNPDTAIEKGYTPKDAESYSIVMPPPNVTGVLHMGHAFEGGLQDAIIRHNRMLGKRTLWIPGTDHAAIATQSKVEKILSKEKIRKQDLGREEFLKRVNEFAQQSHDSIVNQLKTLGVSVDWSREAYTLDGTRQKAVYTAFKTMYDTGLIYRGHRIVNWDPKGQTVISDDEIVRKEETTQFYYFTYGPFTIGTARPETKFGDKYIVMHPDDERYSEYTHGQTIEVEWINGPIEATIIKDEAADPEFGTGVMTITPWHSQIDFEIAERHNLDKEQIIDQYGKLLPIAQEFEGMKITDAREKIIEKLDQKGLLVKVEENYTHQLATAERTGGIIEPQIMTQWFVDVTKSFPYPHDTLPGITQGEEVTLKKLMQHAVREKHVTILPDRFEKTYYHWIDNLRDWCISRQLWFGHRIPAWYNGEETVISQTSPGDGWVQDEDTLDTWFSSGLWTFSTLGWPEQTPDFETYHPTSLVNPGYEILFFWVARMILMSTFLVGQIPFKHAYIHGILRDKSGQKFSKSLNNGVDPTDMIEKYGTDALRMALMIGTTPGSDVIFNEDKVRAYKKFANKLWNITRFILENTEPENYTQPYSLSSEQNKTRIDELNGIIMDITNNLGDYKYYIAGETLYHYIWHTVADEIIEESKPILEHQNEQSNERKQLLAHILVTSLKLLHPFMPFVTEAIWQELPNTDTDILAVSPWPQSSLN